MARQLEQQGKLHDWARRVAERAMDEYAQGVENGMFPLEAESEAKRNYQFLPDEEDQPVLGEDRNLREWK